MLQSLRREHRNYVFLLEPLVDHLLLNGNNFFDVQEVKESKISKKVWYRGNQEWDCHTSLRSVLNQHNHDIFFGAFYKNCHGLIILVPNQLDRK